MYSLGGAPDPDRPERREKLPRKFYEQELERLQVEAKLEAASSAMQTAEIDMRRTRNLLDQGLAAQRDYEQARIKVEELRSRVAEAGAELNRVDINMSRQSVQLVRAPRDGVILSVNGGDSATYVRTGDVRWRFRTIPAAGTFGSDTWPATSYSAPCSGCSPAASSARASPGSP